MCVCVCHLYHLHIEVIFFCNGLGAPVKNHMTTKSQLGAIPPVVVPCVGTSVLVFAHLSFFFCHPDQIGRAHV